MYSMKKINRRHVPFGVLMFMLILVIGLGGRGSLAEEMDIQDDSSFRRAMLQSSPIFAFESSDEAISHWARLWDCSTRLDSHTYNARQSLLMHAIEPLVEVAESESLDPIRSIRDSLEATMVDHAQRGSTPARETCDWILLNNLLGENDRTLEWMSAHDQATVGRLLPRSVREVAQAELGDSIKMDKRGRLLTTTS
tara:strand:- start:272 stop:859 length:588 start_codon:yes stop_codon:yes gene_type:complete